MTVAFGLLIDKLTEKNQCGTFGFGNRGNGF